MFSADACVDVVISPLDYIVPKILKWMESDISR